MRVSRQQPLDFLRVNSPLEISGLLSLMIANEREVNKSAASFLFVQFSTLQEIITKATNTVFLEI
jgi:hypothetical protein